ncbi:Ran-specific GTPase-activating protein 30, partial [Friedmanniomyces endolithicus]
MDILLGRVTQQAMNYAIRSGVTITATYAFKQCGRLLKEAPRSKDREELMQLQLRLESKIRVISPAIDMIELISARGNTSLESAVGLTKDLRYEIQRLGTRLSDAANDEELLRRKSGRAKSREATEREMKSIIASIKSLLVRIEDAVPLISLAITTSGVNLSTNLSGTI